MENYAQILDCTLRDGAYIVDKHFGDNIIKGIVRGLVETQIDIIELGFLQNDDYGEGKTVFANSKDAEKYIPEDRSRSSFAVLADYSRYSIDLLDDYTGKSFDIVRACFFKHERYSVIDFCKKVKEKGYKLFVQPVDILGYTDMELLELIHEINKIEPYCVSIVDTFGSMYIDDLVRIYNLIHHNLIETCKMGFHSHNNMQMSNALSQEFLKLAQGNRKVVVDSTISGMGRGAGNTPTELITQYMVSKMGSSYDMDAILDVIDQYMNQIQARCSWGYNTPYFIAGSYGAHVNNIAYLTFKNSIRSKDIRFILNKIGMENRKNYDYDNLEKVYMEYLNSDIDDYIAIEKLKKELEGKNIVIMVPGKSVSTYTKKIMHYIQENDAVVISINFIFDNILCDYIYMSNIKRYNYWRDVSEFKNIKKILTSNILTHSSNENEIIVSFVKLVKCGWENLDNSTVLLLRLLDKIQVKSIAIAGFDGYDMNPDNGFNYAQDYLELATVKVNPILSNKEIKEMLADYMQNRSNKAKIKFITPSKFEDIVKETI